MGSARHQREPDLLFLLGFQTGFLYSMPGITLHQEEHAPMLGARRQRTAATAFSVARPLQSVIKRGQRAVCLVGPPGAYLFTSRRREARKLAAPACKGG